MCDNVNLRDQVVNLQAQVAFWQAKAEAAEGELVELRKRIKSLERDVLRAEHEAHAASMKLEEKQAALQKTQTAMMAKEKQIADKLEAVKAEQAKVEKKYEQEVVAAHSTEMLQTKKELQGLKTAEEEQKKELKQLQQEKEKLRDANTKLRAQLEAAKKKIVKLQGEIDQMKVLLGQKVVLGTCDDCDALKSQISKLENTLKDAVQGRDAAQKIVDRNNRVWGKVHADAALEQLGKRIENRLEDLMRFEPDKMENLLNVLRRVMSGDIGIAVQTWCVNSENAMKASAELSAKRLADASKMKGGFCNVENIIARWRTAAARSLIQNWRNDLSHKKEADKTDAEAAVASQHRQEVGVLQSDLQQSREATEALESDLQRAQEGAKMTEADLERAVEETKALKDEIDRLRQVLDDLKLEAQLERDTFQDEIERLQQELARQKEELASERAQSKRDYDQLKEDVAKSMLESEAKVNGLLHETQRFQEQLSQAHEELEGERQAWAAEKEVLATEKQAEMDKMAQDKVDAMKQFTEDLKTLKAERSQKGAESDKKYNEHKEERSKLKNEIEKLKAKLQEAKHDLSLTRKQLERERQANLEEQQGLKSELEKMMCLHEGEIRSLHREIGRLQEALDRAEAALNDSNNEKMRLTKALQQARSEKVEAEEALEATRQNLKAAMAKAAADHDMHQLKSKAAQDKLEAELELQKNELKHTSQKLIDENAKMKEECDKVKNELVNERQQGKDAQLETVTAHEKEQEQLKDEIQAMEDQKQAELALLSEELSQLKEQLSELKMELELTRGKVLECEQRLSTERADHAAEKERLRHEHDRLVKGHKDTIQRLTEELQRLRNDLDTAQDSLADERKATKGALAKLAEEAEVLKREKLELVTDLSKHKGIVDELCQDPALKGMQASLLQKALAPSPSLAATLDAHGQRCEICGQGQSPCCKQLQREREAASKAKKKSSMRPKSSPGAMLSPVTTQEQDPEIAALRKRAAQINNVKKKGPKRAEVKTLGDLARELDKFHIADFDFFRHGDECRTDRMSFTGFRAALDKYGIAAQDCSIEVMFKKLSPNLGGKVSYMVLHDMLKEASAKAHAYAAAHIRPPSPGLTSSTTASAMGSLRETPNRSFSPSRGRTPVREPGSMADLRDS